MKQMWRCSLALQLFVVAYLLAFYDVVPVLRYFPTLHIWQTAAIKGQPAMSWFCYCAYGLAGAAIGYLLGGVFGKVQEKLKFDLAGPCAAVATLVYLVCTISHEAHKWFS